MEDFSLVDDWEERYRLVIDLGKGLAPLTGFERDEAHKVRGCAAQVWLVAEEAPGGQLVFRGDSDAHIVRGLIAILLALYSGNTPDAILAKDPHAMFKALGLEGHLTQQRSNGFFAMVERIRKYAADAKLRQSA